jgi:hypothetical protein
MVDGADFARNVQTRLAPADANDFLGKISLPQRESDRAPDQTDSDNRDCVVFDHHRILEIGLQSGEGAGRVYGHLRRFTRRKAARSALLFLLRGQAFDHDRRNAIWRRQLDDAN